MMQIGKQRFQTLRSAVRRGDQYCPYDGRFIAKDKKTPSESREKVHDFLQSLYEESAEVIPDGLNSNKRPRQGVHKLDGKEMKRDAIKHLPPAIVFPLLISILSCVVICAPQLVT